MYVCMYKTLLCLIYRNIHIYYYNNNPKSSFFTSLSKS